MIHKLRILPVLAIFAVCGSAFTPDVALATLMVSPDFSLADPTNGTDQSCTDASTCHFEYGDTSGVSEGDIDEVSGVVTITKTFRAFSHQLQFAGYVESEGGMMFSENIVNSTGVDWTDFHLGLSFDLLGNEGSMAFSSTSSSSSGISCGLDSGTSITCLGDVASGSSFDVDFNILVGTTDEGLNFWITQYPTNDRQPPTVPEPTTLALLGLALSGLGISRGKKTSTTIA